MRAGNVRAVVRDNTPENVKRFTAEINPFGGHLVMLAHCPALAS